jgi:DNA-binding transcriptional LysR family regulator
MESALRALTEDAQSTLDVFCLGSFSMRWLIPRLYHFNALHPGIDVRLSTRNQQAQMPAERYDVVIDVAEQAARTPAFELFPECLGPVLAPGLASTLQLRNSADLAGLPLLRTRTRRNAWAMWCHSIGLPALTATGAEFEHYFFSLEAALGGLGICVAPWHLVADEVLAGRLLAPFGFQPSGYHYVARGRLRHKHAELFCLWLAQQAAQAPPPPLCAFAPGATAI